MFVLSLLLCSMNLSDALQVSPRKGPPLLAGLVTHTRRPCCPLVLTFSLPQKNPQMAADDDTAAEPESEQDEQYRHKLAETQIAIVEAEEALRWLYASSSRPPLATTTRVKLSKTDAGTLILELPPTGLSSETVFAGALSIAWFSVVLPPTFSGVWLYAATFSGVWLIMLPFWAVGALIAKETLVDPFVTSKLTLGQYAWSFKSIYGGRNGITLNEKAGATDDLRSAGYERIDVVDGMPWLQYVIKLYGSVGATSLPMGTQVSVEEVKYLVDEINDHLRELQDMPDPGLLRPRS
jgi:hypothetical protein